MEQDRNIRIGGVLKEYGFISDEQLSKALEYQKNHAGEKLGEILINLGFITERQMLSALAQRLNYKYVELAGVQVDKNAVALLPRSFSEKNNMLAVAVSNNMLTVIVNDPMNFVEIEEAGQRTGMQINVWLAEKAPLQKAIQFYYSAIEAKRAAESASVATISDNIFTERELGDAPIVNLLDNLVKHAYHINASDIHVEPYENETLLRMRVDGTITDYDTIPKNIHPALITRIKIISDLDIGERRIPQDGHFKINIDGNPLNVRVSLIPTVFGEKAVMRLLASTNNIDRSASYGMQQSNFEKFSKMLKVPNGIIYISGPTGSGKTTTLYMVLNELAHHPVSIATIEDPVEKTIAHVNHMQVNQMAGLTFEAGLRAILRQDPDIIMVGETRDAETADISVRSAISGHLVLSTIHTTDAASTVVRLANMGIERYMIASSLVGIVAQRLLRKLCPQCSYEDNPTEEEVAFMGKLGTVKRARGCKYCNGGYRGRIAIHEILLADNEVKNMITNSSSVADINDYAVKHQHMQKLWESGAELVRQGITSPEELMRVTYSI